MNLNLSAQRAARDQSEDYCRPEDVLVYRDTPQGIVGTPIVRETPAKRTALRCDGGWSCCTGVVSMIGNKGYAYCGPCGIERRQSGNERTRKLTPVELLALQAGRSLTSY